MRPTIQTGEFYHIYNRGVDKRTVFEDKYDIARFLQSMREFNVHEPIGSIYENSFQLGRPTSKYKNQNRLVNVLAYCLNPNHFHFIIEQLRDGGVSEFMKRLGGGYTKYFNERHKRSGALFQGKYKYVHVESDSHLRHLSAYVNLNDKVHQLGRPTSKLVESASSFRQYIGKGVSAGGYVVENKEMVLSSFKNGVDYEKYAYETLEWMIQNKEENRSLILE